MKNGVMSCMVIARQLGSHHGVITRLVQKTNATKDHPRFVRTKTFILEDRDLLRLIRHASFTSAPTLSKQWNTNRRFSVQTVRDRLKAANYCACRPLQRLMRCSDRLSWKLASWRRIHWSSECRMLLQVTDGRVRVWRQDKNQFAPEHIQTTLQGCGGSVTI